MRRPTACATCHCAISTPAAPIRTASLANGTIRRRISSREPSQAAAGTYPASAGLRQTTTRRPTEPACATTSTSPIWPARTCLLSTTLPRAARTLRSISEPGRRLDPGGLGRHRPDHGAPSADRDFIHGGPAIRRRSMRIRPRTQGARLLAAIFRPGHDRAHRCAVLRTGGAWHDDAAASRCCRP